jgi:hypothetical protein
MIIDIFSISAMSDKLEKIFFGARRTVNWDKGQIISEIMKWREYLKY